MLEVKMTKYSYSKIKAYENCPYQYKLKYIDKLKADVSDTIETFMGDIVHRSLDYLYKRKKFRKRISKKILIKFYRDLWNREYSKDIRIVKEGIYAEDYRKMGEKYLSDYYDRMKPFEQMIIIALETQDSITLPDGNKWHVRIDKLGCDNEGNYYVCDYKTSLSMKEQEEADSDRQLAMYSIWVRDKFKDAKSVKLVWHMLAFNKEIISDRTEEQLKKLQEGVVEIIKKIKSAKEFPRKQSALCDYCFYRDQCPSFKHKVESDKIEDVKRFKENDGVKLVDEFSEIRTRLAELKSKEEKFKEKLMAYAKRFAVDIVYGSNMKCSVKEIDKVILPEDKEEKEKFIKLIKDLGLYDEYSMICYSKLNSKVIKGEIETEIKDAVKIVKDFRLSLSKRKDLDEE